MKSAFINPKVSTSAILHIKKQSLKVDDNDIYVFVVDYSSLFLCLLLGD